MKATKQVNILDLKVGDIAHAHGARFEIVSTTIYDEKAFGNTSGKEWISDVMSANAKWIDGRIETGYFGPNKDWSFQGNKLVTVTIEV